MTLEVRIAHRFSGFSLDVDFAIKHSGVTALFGPSGSGKTTIINTVAGLFRPHECRIALAGEVLADTSARTFVAPRRRHMGYVFQDARLFPHLQVRDNLLYGARRSAEPPSRHEIASIIDLLGLGRLLTRLPRNLSGGEKQRVTLGRALLASPRLLLLDEPLAALGQAMKDEILPYLVRLRDEARVPMLYVSHSVDEIARIADDLILLSAGQVTAQGSVFDLFSSLTPEAEPLSEGAVIETRLKRQVPEEQLSELSFGNAELLVPALALSPGATVRLRILARDITIALDPPGRISANNVLPVVIGGVRILASGEADVQLVVGEARLIARITRYSLGRLALTQGMNAYAIIKSVTVDRRALRSAS